MAILEKSDLLLGIDHIFKEVDFNRLYDVNDYYKRILKRSATPKPAFVGSVDIKKMKSLGPKLPKTLTVEEKNYAALHRIGSINHPLTRAEVLSIIRNLTKQYPGDLGLQLTCSRILIHRELYTDAMTLLHRCTQLDPKCDYAWAHIALMAALAQDHGRAAYSARKALELGNNLLNTMQKAFVFSLFAQGIPAKVGPFETEPHFQITSGSIKVDEAKLPDVTYLYEPEKLNKNPVILIACDSGYFKKFAKNLMLSLVEVSASFSIHVHLVTPDEDDIAWLDKYRITYNNNIIVTSEKPNDTALTKLPAYLASCRFLQSPVFLRRFKRDYLVLDADSVLNTGEGLKKFIRLSKYPVLYYAERGPIWDTISAPFVFLPHGKASLRFIDHCQKYLMHMFFRGKPSSFWYIDQLALLGAYLESAETIRLCPARLLSDVRCSEDSIFWTLSNNKNEPRYVARCAELEALAFEPD